MSNTLAGPTSPPRPALAAGAVLPPCLYDALPLPVLLVNPQGWVMSTNDAYRRAVAPRTVAGNELHEHWQGGEQLMAETRPLLAARARGTQQLAVAVRRQGQEFLPAMASASPLPLQGPPGVVVVLDLAGTPSARREPTTATSSSPGQLAPDGIAEILAQRGLTARESEIVQALLRGQRVGSIASRLFISEHTVRNHLRSIFRKLGVRSQRELVDALLIPPS